MITYQMEESDGYMTDRFIAEAGPMLEKHYQEIEDHHNTPLDIDVDKYRAVEQMQNLRLFTVRNDGELVGYAIFILMEHMHSKDRILAVSDALFLAPEWRKGRIGVNIIKFSDKLLAQEGVDVVWRNVTVGLDYSAVLDYLGYEPVFATWSKWLSVSDKNV